jgi:hypothetical protein
MSEKIILGEAGKKALQEFKNGKKLLSFPMRMHNLLNNCYFLGHNIGKLSITITPRENGFFINMSKDYVSINNGKVSSWEDAEDWLAEALTFKSTNQRAKRVENE